MKKKIPFIVTAAVIVVAVIFAFASNKKEDDGTLKTPQVGEVVVIDITTKEETTKKSETKSLEDMIKVTLPLDFVDAEYRDNLNAFAKAKGYKSVTLVNDKQVLIEMKEFSYGLLLTRIGMTTVSGIADTIESEDYPYVTGLANYNDDFSQVAVRVDKKGYNEAENTDELFNHVAMFALYYQLYDNDSKMKCEILILEEETNVLLETKTLTANDIKL